MVGDPLTGYLPHHQDMAAVEQRVELETCSHWKKHSPLWWKNMLWSILTTVQRSKGGIQRLMQPPLAPKL